MSQPKFTGFAFDASTITPAAPLEPVPIDYYTVVISDGEIKPTGDGSGKLFAFELTIMEGPFAKRKVFDRLNIENPSAQAQEIAQQQLSAICHSIGVIRFTDVQELFNKPFIAKVGLDPKREDPDQPGKWYEARNNFKGAKPVNGAALPGAVAPGAAGAAPAPNVAKTPAVTPPWVKPAAAAAPAPMPTATAPAPAAAAPVTAAIVPGGGPKKGPKKPGAAAPVEKKYFVYFDDNNMPLKTETEIRAMLAQGMPDTTMLNPEAGPDDDWKPASEFGLKLAPAAAAAPAGGGAALPPWMR